jgi:hypothetical protein
MARTATGGAVIAAATGGGGRIAPALTLVDASGGPQPVAVTAIKGVTQPGVAVNGIATAGATEVAVGGADGSPAAWASGDGGSTWSRGAGGALARTGEQQLTAAAHGRAGWVAVGGQDAPAGSAPAGTAVPGSAVPGNAASGDGAPGSVGGGLGGVVAAPGHPVVVSSPDGQYWTTRDGAGAFGAAGLVTSAVAASGAGYVIAGWQAAGGHTTAMAWYSAGLAGWRALRLPAAGGDTMATAVAATSRGFVAVGTAGGRPAAWTTANGTQWQPVSVGLPDAGAVAALGFVAASGQAVAATGTEVTPDGRRRPFAAVSADGGATWTQQALPAPPGPAPGSLEVTALTAAGGGFTATGMAGAPGNQDVVIWTHDPAEGGTVTSGTWEAAAPAGYGLSGPGVQAITALAAAGSTLTGAGFTATGAAESPTIWQSPIRG